MTDEEIIKLLYKFHVDYVAIKTGLSPEYIRQVRIRNGLIKGTRRGPNSIDSKKRALSRKERDLKKLVEQINKVNKMNLVFKEAQ